VLKIPPTLRPRPRSPTRLVQRHRNARRRLRLPPSSLSSLTAEEAALERERRKRANGKAALPSTLPDFPSFLALGNLLANSIADSLPLLSQLRQAQHLKRELDAEAEDEDEKRDAEEVVRLYRREIWTSAADVALGVFF
jgi:hypothetical protein